MKNLKKILNLIVILLISFIFGYFSLTNINLIKKYSELKEEKIDIKISITGKKNNLSKGYETRILEVIINGEKISLEKFLKDSDTFVLSDGMILGYSGELIITVPKNVEVSIRFLKHPWSGIIEITDKLPNKEKIDLYSKNDEVYDYEYKLDSQIIWNECKKISNIIQKDNIFTYIICVSIMFIAFLNILIFLKKLKLKRLRIWNIISFSFSIFLILIFTIYVILKLIGIIIFPVLLIGILGFILYYRKIFEENIHYAFAFIYPLMACFFLFLLPPGHIPDEYSHFVKAYEASLIGDSHTTLKKGFEQQGEVYIYLPKAIENLSNQWMNNLAIYNVSYNIDNYFISYSEKVNPNDLATEYYWFGNTKGLNIVCYLPAIIISFILNFFHVPAIFYFHLIRFIHLLLVVLGGYFLLKKVPFYKRIFMVIMLLPMTIQQNIGINQDWLTNLVCFLFAALLIKEIYEDKQIEIKDLIFLMILGIIVANVKLGYFGISFLAVLIPRKRFKNQKSQIICKICIIVPCIVFTVLQYLNAISTVSSDGNLPYYSIDFIFLHPIKTIQIYWNTLMEYGGYHFNSGLVSGFGWYTHYSKNLTVVFMSILVLLLMFGNQETIKIKRSFRIITFGSFVVISAFIYTSLFLGWTTINGSTIMGLQPRYFIIPLLMLILSCQNSIISLKIKKMNTFYIISMIFILMIGVYTLTGFY